ncbi:ferritin-like protein [Massilia sp.]|uniref:ferritin-like domain-containing protein n=1 Tax=Massilia sp. TaxID=1882437 RepID=UPI00352BECAD
MTLDQEKEDLVAWLHTALAIELSTIPVYMTALISIKPGSNRVPANLIRGVMMEEMLHLALAGNLLSAIGGKAAFFEANIPTYPLTLKFDGKTFRGREFAIELAPFSAQNTEVFTQIEYPDVWSEPGAELTGVSEVDVPGYTIGGFYAAIATKLAQLCEEFGEPTVFSGDPQHQLGLNYYWAGGGRPILITDLVSAKRAIDLIVSQGEGSDQTVFDRDASDFGQPEDAAHFFRFREIQYAQSYRKGDDPRQPPTGNRFEVDYSAVYPIKVNPKQADYSEDLMLAKLNMEFNALYTRMLTQIADAFNGAPASMYTAILNSMHGMTGIALQMVATPIANDPEGRHGAPSFEWVEPLA